MVYDWIGRKTSEELFHASGATPRSYSFTYDNNGNVLTTTDAKSQTLTYTYDELDRPLTENTNEVAYVYDTGSYGIGRLASVTSAGATKAYQYNILGQVTQESKTINSTQYNTSFTYDLFGSPLSITYPDSTSVTYAYNNAGQLEQIPDYVTDFDYSPIGSVSKIHYSNGAVTTNTYDPTKLYRLTDKQTTIGGSDIQDIAYTFDPVGNITNITDTSATSASKTANYGYDDLHRLTSATITNTGNSQNYTRTYTYSPTGNILTKSDVGSYTYNDYHPHAVTTAGSQNFTYDLNGSLLTDGTWTHSYDTRNRLTSSAKTGQTVSYTYDEGRTRVTKNDGSKTVTYVNDYYEIDDTTPRKFIMAGSLKIATVEPGGSGGSSGMPSDTNLVGYWKFDEGSGTTATDSSGNGNDLTINGATYTTGVSNTALNYVNNTDRALLTPLPSELQTGSDDDLSFSVWIKTTATGERIILDTRKGGYIDHYLLVRALNNVIQFILRGDGGGSITTMTGTTPINDGQWHHIVCVRDTSADLMRLYVDGVEDTEAITDTTTGTITDADSNWQIGRQYTVLGSTWVGDIDEPRMYNTAVTPTQVTALYNDPIQLPSDTNLKGYWKFDEGSGTVITDSSGNNNDGTLYGGTAYSTGASETALDFDGTDDYGSAPVSLPAGQDGVSNSVWVYVDELPVGEKKGIMGMGYQHHCWLYMDGRIDYGTWTSVTNYEWLTTKAINVGQWNHIVNVVDYEHLMAYSYINGELAGSNPFTGTSVGMNNVQFGRHPGYNGNYLDGRTDEARVYNKALTAGEVMALYQEYPDANLVGYWNFDEGSGTTAYDSSGYGNDGTISGAVYSSGALSFDGADDSVKVDDAASVQNMWDGGGSISFVINADTIGETNGGRLLDKNGAGTGWLVSVTNASNGHCQLQMFYAFSTHFGLWKTTYAEIELGKTTSVIVTYDADSVSNTPVFYIDGQSVPVTRTYIPVGTRASDVGLDMYIGNNYSGLYSFDGWLDEPRAYNSALTPAQVQYLYQQNAPSSYTGGTVFHHTDHLSGSNVATDANGNLIELNDYYPYGDSRIEEKAEGYANDYLFTGQERDEETDLYYYGARYYDPVIGRFTSVDPWAGDISDPQSLNKYSYVRNNPLKYVDPSGENPVVAAIVAGIAFTMAYFGGTQVVNAPAIDSPTIPAKSEAEILIGTAVGEITGEFGGRILGKIGGEILGFGFKKIKQLKNYRKFIKNGIDPNVAAARAKDYKKCWGNSSAIDDHFTRHGQKEFGFKTPEEYTEKAMDFYSQKGLQKKVDTEGVTRIYDSETNTFGSYNSDGTVRTFMKPTGGQKYFDKQAGELITNE